MKFSPFGFMNGVINSSPTPTPTPTITPTPTNYLNVGLVTFLNNFATSVSYNEYPSDLIYNMTGLVSGVTYTTPTCTYVESIYADGGITILSVSPCLTPTPTPTQTRTNTPTPTPSSGATFSASVQIGSTADAACYAPQITTNVTSNNNSFCFAGTLTGAGLASLSNGNYYVSYGGNTINMNISGAPTTVGTITSSGCQACPAVTPTPTVTKSPTPTPTITSSPTPSITPTRTITPTPSTSAPVTYDYYLADEYSCADCSFQNSNVPVAFVAGTSINMTNWYYARFDSAPFVYKNFTPTTAGVSAILITTGAGTSCPGACPA